jgi:2-amino-4-hydroxy-6-hydroxymethyldihydropteridine diphosphokinase
VALGGNLGGVLRTFRWALRVMPRWGLRVTGVSSAYRTAALLPEEARGAASVPDYWNAVCTVETALGPSRLLSALHCIEAAAGRTRPHRWAPRTLDLDLLVHGDRVIEGPRLTLPHPRLAERPFVLQPLLELAPEASVPGWGLSVAALVRRQPDPLCGIREVRPSWLGPRPGLGSDPQRSDGRRAVWSVPAVLPSRVSAL